MDNSYPEKPALDAAHFAGAPTGLSSPSAGSTSGAGLAASIAPTGVESPSSQVTPRRPARRGGRGGSGGGPPPRWLEAILRHTNEGFVLLDREGAFQYVSPAVSSILGYEPPDLLGQDALSYLHPDDFLRLASRFADLLAHPGATFTEQYRLRHKDGSYRWIEGIGTNLLDAPEVDAVVASYHDITRPKQMEEELRENLQLNWVILNSMPAQVAVLDESGTIMVVNPTWREAAHETTSVKLVCGHFGDDYLELARQVGRELGGDAVDAWKGVQAVIRAERESFNLVYRAVDPSAPRWYSLNAARLARQQGGAVILHTDVTERQEAQEAIRALNLDLERRIQERTLQLQNANRELEAFAYSISHDLRAPLRSISGFVRALEEEEELSTRGQGYLERVAAASERMNQLILAMLNLSRVMRAEIRREPVDLTSIVWQVAVDLQSENEGRAVKFEIADEAVVLGDESLLRNALANLIQNAWKFTRHRSLGEITFGNLEGAAAPPGHEVYFVRDNGAGFDMAQGSRLFAPFQRLHTEREFEGTGIGLATVSRIVQRHGGRIWAESEVEKGATFYFTLPSWR